MYKFYTQFFINIRNLSYCVLLLCVYSASSQANTQWRLDKDEDGVKVYLRDTKGSALKSFKSTVTLNTNLSSILAVIRDTTSYPRWLHNCRSAKTLKREGARKSINYIVTNMPWPVVDRDVIVSSVLTQNRSNKRIEIKLNALPKFTPKVNGKVRIEKMQGRWLLTPTGDSKVNVVYELAIDPGGNIPKWVVNSMAVDLPFNTLQKLKTMVKQAPYDNAKIEGILE